MSLDKYFVLAFISFSLGFSTGWYLREEAAVTEVVEFIKHREGIE